MEEEKNYSEESSAEEQPASEEKKSMTEEASSPVEEENPERTQNEIRSALITDAGIAGDKFDRTITPPEQEGNDEFITCDSIDIWYDFNKDEISQAMKIFQKKTIFKKNLFYSLIVFALFIVQLSQILNGSTEKMNMVICVICVAVLAMIWYTPKNQIRQVQKALDTYEEPPRYFMSIYPGAVRTGTGEKAVLFRFDTDNIRVFETDNLFIVSFQNQSLFPIPKRCLDGDEQIEAIRNCFSEHLGSKYERIS